MAPNNLSSVREIAAIVGALRRPLLASSLRRNFSTCVTFYKNIYKLTSNKNTDLH